MLPGSIQRNRKRSWRNSNWNCGVKSGRR